MYERTRAGFSAVFPKAGVPRVVRCPGRINLMGEHLDYNGLPVLPMAIDRSIWIAYTPLEKPEIHLINAADQHPRIRFKNAIDFEAPNGDWSRFAQAAFRAVHREVQPAKLPGLAAYVDSDLPEAAGLSSSSALVVGFALAYLDCLNAEPIDPLQLADALALGERFVGTEGGGMDQAVLLGAPHGQACKIDFAPLRIEPLPLFKGLEFVVCNSLVRAEKSSDGAQAYNAGPKLSRLVCRMLERAAQRLYSDEICIDSVADLWYGPLCLTHDEADAVFREAFPNDHLSVTHITETLGITVQEFRAFGLEDTAEPAQTFPLGKRARHIFSEFRRVELAREAMLCSNPAQFGELMDASHQSCANDMEVSCPELDALHAQLRNAGALGARMTGAGGGGCVIALAPEGQIGAIRATLAATYYLGREATRHEKFMDDAVFAARPAHPAGISST